MSVWDEYKARVCAHGNDKRSSSLAKEMRYVSTKVRDNLSYQEVTIDCKKQSVAIIRSNNLNEKYIYSLPGEDFKCGSLVWWEGNHWLITERDAANEVYTRGKLLQCNYKLKWVDDNDVVRSQWCVVEDGTKLRIIVSVQRNLYEKTSIELLGSRKAHITTA